MARMRSSIVFAASVRIRALPAMRRPCRRRFCWMLPWRSGCAKVFALRLFPPGPPPAPVGEDGVRGIVAGRAGDAAAWMRAGAAMIETGKRPTIVGITEHGPGPEQLVERHRAV